MNEELNSVTCPISRHIFLEPVIAEDEQYYEKSCIEEWFKENITSPIYRTYIGKTLIQSNK